MEAVLDSSVLQMTGQWPEGVRKITPKSLAEAQICSAQYSLSGENAPECAKKRGGKRFADRNKDDSKQLSCATMTGMNSVFVYKRTHCTFK